MFASSMISLYDSEEDSAFRDLIILDGANKLLKSNRLQDPNVLFDEKLSYVLVQTFFLNSCYIPAI